jgi:hypothetical protein
MLLSNNSDDVLKTGFSRLDWTLEARVDGTRVVVDSGCLAALGGTSALVDLAGRVQTPAEGGVVALVGFVRLQTEPAQGWSPALAGVGHGLPALHETSGGADELKDHDHGNPDD